MNHEISPSRKFSPIIRGTILAGLALATTGSVISAKKAPLVGVDCKMFSSVMSSPDPICSPEDNYVKADPKSPGKVIEGRCYESGYAFGLWRCDLP